jgi:hypothetical protein
MARPSSDSAPRPSGQQKAPARGRGRIAAVAAGPDHSTVTLLARFLGWSTLQPRRSAT